MKADPRKLPDLHKEVARRNPGEEVLLPTGAKLRFCPGRRGYEVHGYHDTDAKPFVQQ